MVVAHSNSRISLISNINLVNPQKPVQSLMKLARKFGEFYRLKIVEDLVIVSTQALAAEVCDDKLFDKKVFHALKEIRAFAGDGLFTAFNDEENWARAHRILLPAFGPASLRHMYESMTDVTDQMIAIWEKQGDGAIIDVVDNMTRLTLDTIALAAFDYRFNSFQEKAMHPFVQAMVSGLEEAQARGRRRPFTSRLMFRAKRRFKSDARVMHEIADAVIADRQGKVSSKKDLLAVMLEASDPKTGEKLDVVNIRHQLVTFLIAGHETTSGLMSFALFGMLKDPAILAKARQEVDEVLGGERPTIERLQKLRYLDQILKEALRLWPTAPAFGRVAREETVICGKYRVTPDQVIMVLLPSLHRDPSVWHEPERFDPERMRSDLFQKLPPHSWKPFGTGARACIGRAFAMQEAVLVLARILQTFDLEMGDADYKLQIKETLTWKPEGFTIRCSRRV